MDELKVISRSDAKALGLKYFYTGVACTHGHLDERYVSTGACAECGRINSREAQRVKYAEEKARRPPPVPKVPKVKVKGEKPRSPEQIERMRVEAHKKACKEEAEAQGLLYYSTGIPCNRGHLSERLVRNGECRACKNDGKSTYRKRHPHIGTAKKIRQEHPESIIPLTASEREDIATTYLERNELTESTGILHHVDHIWPLSRGGVHHPLNLQVLPHTENASKGAKTDLENPIVRQGFYCTLFGKGRLIKITRAV